MNIKRLGAIFVALSLLVNSSLFAEESGPELPLTVTPAGYVGKDLKSGSDLDLVFVLANSSSKAVHLKYIFAECDCSLTVPEQGVVPANGEFILKAHLCLKDFGPGLLDEAITILADHPRQHEIKIPVSGTVTEDHADGHYGNTWRK